MVRGALPVGALYLLLWNPPAGTDTQILVYLVVTAILIRIIFKLKLADIIINVTSGGPGGATDSVTSFIFREYRDRSNVGYGTLLAGGGIRARCSGGSVGRGGAAARCSLSTVLTSGSRLSTGSLPSVICPWLPAFNLT